MVPREGNVHHGGPGALSLAQTGRDEGRRQGTLSRCLKLDGLISGTGAPLGLYSGTGALRGLNSGTRDLRGLNSGTGLSTATGAHYGQGSESEVRDWCLHWTLGQGLGTALVAVTRELYLWEVGTALLAKTG